MVIYFWHDFYSLSLSFWRSALYEAELLHDEYFFFSINKLPRLQSLNQNAILINHYFYYCNKFKVCLYKQNDSLIKLLRIYISGFT